MPKGRKDGKRSKILDTINLPAPTLNASQLIRIFELHGFTAQETVALSGAHTLGVARCSPFKQRLSNFDSTHSVDPSINSNFAKTLARMCNVGDNTEQPFGKTRNDFDNAYYNGLLNKAGVLTSDQTLFTSAATRVVVNGYATNKAMFFYDFQRATVKMSMHDVKEGTQGEVRFGCRRINN